MELEQRAAAFLRTQGMDPEGIDMAEQVALFQAEMAHGLAGEKSSLAMIPTYISPPQKITPDLPVLAVDAGGTHFRAARVTFTRDQGPVLDHYRRFPMPGTEEAVSSSQFFQQMAGYVQDLAEKCQRIGFCFSYPVEMLPSRDGRVIKMAKEMRVSGISGRLVGRELAEALTYAGINNKWEIVLLNDTVAALLASSARREERLAQIGLILGTGCNTCYLESGAQIGKIKGWPEDRQMVINVESGAYALAPRGCIDREFDRTLMDPGCFLLEKMISGRYLGPLLLALLRAAAADGLLSATCRMTLEQSVELPSTAMNSLLAGEGDSSITLLAGTTAADRDLIASLASSLVRRAAVLTAIVLASLALKTGCGQDPAHPLTIFAEGSTFYRLKGLEAGIRQALDAFLTRERGRHYRFIGGEHAVLLGSAVAAAAEA